MSNPLEVEAPAGVPFIDWEREFDAPVEAVFRAHKEPDLIKQWLGPRGYEMDIDTYDFRTGGRYRGHELTAVWDEQAQAEYAERLCRVLFAHPAVRVITWWDLADRGARKDDRREDRAAEGIQKRIGERRERLVERLNDDGVVFSSLSMLNAVLVSSSARPCSYCSAMAVAPVCWRRTPSPTIRTWRRSPVMRRAPIST